LLTGPHAFVAVVLERRWHLHIPTIVDPTPVARRSISVQAVLDHPLVEIELAHA
jgi:hypothetical protein